MAKSPKGQHSKEQSEAADRREKALDAALKQIEKNYGAGSIMRLAPDKIPAIAGISTGALSLDLALGGVGMPRGMPEPPRARSRLSAPVEIPGTETIVSSASFMMLPAP